MYDEPDWKYVQYIQLKWGKKSTIKANKRATVFSEYTFESCGNIYSNSSSCISEHGVSMQSWPWIHQPQQIISKLTSSARSDWNGRLKLPDSLKEIDAKIFAQNVMPHVCRFFVSAYRRDIHTHEIVFECWEILKSARKFNCFWKLHPKHTTTLMQNSFIRT